MKNDDHRLCLLVSRRCNIRCGFCPVEFTGQDMNLDVAKRAVKSYLRHLPAGVSPKVKFFGGEPLLNWPVIQALIEDSRAENLGILFQISTNGMFLDNEKIQYLKTRPEVEATLSFRTAGGYSLPGAWFTFVLTQNQPASSVISKMRILIVEGYRRFNFLPAYFSLWNDDELSELEKTFQALTKLFYGLWDKGMDYRIKNSEVLSPIPLYNAALTVDADGAVYSSSLIESRNMDSLRGFLKIGSVKDWPKEKDARRDGRFLRELLSRWAGPTWDSTQRVDEALSRFVETIDSYSPKVYA